MIDRDKASDLGVNSAGRGRHRADLRRGQPVSKYKEGDEQYDIWLRAEPGKRRTPQDVYDLTVRCAPPTAGAPRQPAPRARDLGPRRSTA